MPKTWHDGAWEEYLSWQERDKKTLKKINNLLKDITRNGYNCAGQLEPLKGDLAGFYSVHIDKKNRIVFRVTVDVVEILQCGSHYGEK